MKNFLIKLVKWSCIIFCCTALIVFVPWIVFPVCIIGFPIYILIKLLKKDNPDMFKPVDHGRIVKAVILSTAQTNKTGSAVGRAVVGDFVAGPVGAIVGASTSKKKTTTRFLLIYADNFRQTVDVADGSCEYKEYMYYL